MQRFGMTFILSGLSDLYLFALMLVQMPVQFLPNTDTETALYANMIMHKVHIGIQLSSWTFDECSAPLAGTV